MKDLTVVVGAGQAGLAVSRELGRAGVEHVVLERGRVAESWRGRWDSFCLNTPNWTVSLPGMPYSGDQPQGFMDRAGIVDYLEAYAASGAAPVRTGVEVTGLAAAPGGGFALRTSDGEIRARQVVVASGAFQKAYHPVPAEAFPARLLVIDAEQYRRPSDLPPGRVLVIGSGQTGCQISEDLLLAGHEVALACGRAPWAPRRLDGVDVVDWLSRTPWFDHPLSGLPAPGARLMANVLISGTEGGHDLNLRTLRAAGVLLLGHLTGVSGSTATFADDLAASVDFGDQRYADTCAALARDLPLAGHPVPEFPVPEPFAGGGPTSLDLGGFGTVIHTSGYRPDYSWIDLPVADGLGFPVTVDGASTVAPGLYFVGVHYLRKRKSALLFGVGEDAALVAAQVAGAG